MTKSRQSSKEKPKPNPLNNSNSSFTKPKSIKNTINHDTIENPNLKIPKNIRTRKNSEADIILNSPIVANSFINEIDKLNKEIQLSNFTSINYIKLETIIECLGTDTNSKMIWKTFTNCIEKVINNNKYINNINYSTQNVIKTENNSNYEKMKKQYKELKTILKEKENHYETLLIMKDKELGDMNALIENKEKFIKDLENLVNHLNKKFTALKEKEDDSSSQKSSNSYTNDEIYMYQYKQLLRDYNTLNNENKNLRDKIQKIENELNIRNEKEIKIMKLLYYLNKQGIHIDQLLQQEASNEDVEVSILTINESSIFTPINIDPPKDFIKPEFIPNLDFTNLNSKYNNEYLSPDHKEVKPVESELMKTYNNINKNNSYQAYNINDTFVIYTLS
jgi:hypothetical protein